MHKNPKPTVDVIIELPAGIVLIERKNPPPGWALPGGFVDEGEPMEEAAVREMQEETGLDVVLTDLLYVYSDPRRDPRHHTVTAVYVGRPAHPDAQPKAGDDAGRVVVVPADQPPQPLAFDHARILEDYRAWKATGKKPDPGQRLEMWKRRDPL